MTQEHPIRPPYELVMQWVSLACELEGNETWIDLATEAARWGADQELEACCEWIRDADGYDAALGLQADRHPKPPSLKEQALAALSRLNSGALCANPVTDKEIIRRALESLPE